MDDLDSVASRPELVSGQLDDLETLGLDWGDGEVVFQSRPAGPARGRAGLRLVDAGLTYPCYCTRREIPRGDDGAARVRIPRAAIRARVAEPDVVRTNDAETGGVGRRLFVSEVNRPLCLCRSRSVGISKVWSTMSSSRETTELLRTTSPSSSTTTTWASRRSCAATIFFTPRRRSCSVHAQPRLRAAVVCGCVRPSARPRRRASLETSRRHTLGERLALGQSAGEVRAELAASVGLCAPGEQPSLDELLARFDPSLLNIGSKCP